jgi:hypothetical protein
MGDELNEQHRCKMEAEGISGEPGTRILEMQCNVCYQRATLAIPAHLISDASLLKLIK